MACLLGLGHLHRVPEREVLANARADELGADGALEEALVDLQDALEGPLPVLPRGDHLPQGDARVLELDGDALAARVGVGDLPDHAGDVARVEVDPAVRVLQALRVRCPPQERVGGSGVWCRGAVGRHALQAGERRRRNVLKTHLYITRPAKTGQNKIYMMAIPPVLRVLAVNVALLVVSSVLVAEVKMDEETMVFVLTGLCVLIF